MRYTVFTLLFAALLFSAPLPLRFVGNRQISTDDLYSVLGLRKPYAVEIWEEEPSIEPIAAAQSVSALSSYYRSKGYYRNKVTSQVSETAITITIEENNPIKIAAITINSPLDIDSAISMKPDDRFDQELFSASKAEIKKRYGQAGYCNAQFSSKAWVDIETHLAYLVFDASPYEKCTFGAISVESTPNIDGNLTASILRFEKGDPYSIEAIKQSYNALYAQEAVTRVLINDNERNGSTVPITLTIEEDERPIRLTAGLGYSSDTGFTALAGVKHRNFFGDMKTLSLNVRYSQIRQEASGIFTLPLENRGLFGAEIGYKDELFKGYKAKSTFEKITAKYQGLPTSAMMGFLLDQVKTYDSQDTIAFPNNGLSLVSPIGELNYDTRDKPLDPAKGIWLNANVMGSLLTPGLSDATYFKTLLSGAYIQSFDTQVIGGRVKWGTLRVYNGEVPSSYRFYAGGMNSNRAYTYRDLGPKNSQGNPVGFTSLLEGTAEYRFPVYEEFRGVLFTDFTLISDNYIPDYNRPYWGVGTGLRYVTPIGPIAIDIGIDPNDTTQYAIHFRIGELF